MSQREAVVQEASKLAVDCLYAEKQHFIFAAAARRFAFWMTIVGAVLAAVAGFGGVSKLLDSDIVPWIALASAVLGGIVAAVKPGQLAEQHHQRGVGFSTLRAKLRRFINVVCANPAAMPEDLQKVLENLGAEKSALMALTPETPSGCWFRAAKKSIASGEANYTPAEIAIATGLEQGAHSAPCQSPQRLD